MENRFLNFREYREYKEEVLDPLREYIKRITKELEGSRKKITSLRDSMDLTFMMNYVLFDLEEDDDEYNTFCEGIVLDLDKSINESEGRILELKASKI